MAVVDMATRGSTVFFLSLLVLLNAAIDGMRGVSMVLTC